MQKDHHIEVLWIPVLIRKFSFDDFISITDIAKAKNSLSPKNVVQNRLRLHNTIEYLWLRESINNPNFNRIEFDAFKQESWKNAFTLSPQQRIKNTHASGLISKAGRHGWWTLAHKDIALKFASWISVEFELYLIKEFQRLKEQELKGMDRTVKRFLTKMNYKIHTDAIKDHLIPLQISKLQVSLVYADEADVLNIALYGQTAKERRVKNPKDKGNIRDTSTIEQLIVLANIESMNAEYIKLWLSQDKRLHLLNQTAISQMKSLLWFNLEQEISGLETR